MTQPKKQKRLRLRITNRFKVLLCYLVSFAVPVLWHWAALWLVYPYKLIGTAPAIADTLLRLSPFQPEQLTSAAAAAGDPLTGSPLGWTEALTARDLHWRLFLTACFAAAWLVTLVVQLIWRIRHSRAINAARVARRAKRSYRLWMLILLMLNAGMAWLVWLLGVSGIPGRTLWDYLAYFPPYLLNVLAALCCFRLAAPPSISGKHAFFKRL